MSLTLNIKTKFFLVLIVFSIIPLLVVSSYSFWQSKSAIEKDTIEALKAINISRESHINDYLRLKYEEAKSIAGNAVIRQLKSDGNNSQETLQDIQLHIDSIYERLSSPSKRYQNLDKKSDIGIVGVWDSQGTIVANTNKDLVGKKMPQYYFQEVKQHGSYFGGLQNDPLTKKNFIIIVEEVRNLESNEFAGAVLLKISTEILNAITTSREGLRESGETYIVDSQNRLITESRFIENAILTLTVNTKGTEKCFAKKEAPNVIEDYRGVRVLSAQSYMKDEGWCLLTEIDEQEAFSSITSLRNQIFVMICALLIIITALVFSASQKLLAPFMGLYDASKKIKAGDYKFELKGDSNDELGELTNTFNDITKDLLKSKTELEQSNALLKRKTLAAQLLHQSTVTASETQSFDEALKGCVDTVCELTGWSVGHVYLPSEDQPDKLFPADIWYLDKEEEYTSFQKAIGRIYFSKGVGFPGRIWESGKPDSISNVQTDSNFQRAKLCADLGFQGVFGFPIKVFNEIVAVLEFFTKEEKSPDDDLLMVLRGVGEQVGRVLERNRVQIALEKETKRAQSAERAKSNFLANMSHEIRTPMNAILGFSDLLAQTSLDEKQEEFLGSIRSSGCLLTGIINDILDFSRLDAKKVTLETHDFDLEYLIHDVLKILSLRLQECSLDAYVDIEKNVPRFLKGDPIRLRQVFINLLGNAIKYTPKGEIGVIVKVGDAVDSDDEAVGLKFIVKDSGIGIPKDQIETIFEFFSQVDESTTRRYEGTGLGLAICRLIIDAMGGKIWAESEEGRGSEFIFIVKLKKGKAARQLDHFA